MHKPELENYSQLQAVKCELDQNANGAARRLVRLALLLAAISLLMAGFSLWRAMNARSEGGKPDGVESAKILVQRDSVSRPGLPAEFLGALAPARHHLGTRRHDQIRSHRLRMVPRALLVQRV